MSNHYSLGYTPLEFDAEVNTAPSYHIISYLYSRS